ncbi:MAG: hypothetical protein M3Z25_00715 [Actinomycetota bacterium]|nr:hypothetical protein [Actinomycetota bacterium]
MVAGARVLTAAGELLDIDAGDPDLLNAARVSLGALGVFTELRMHVAPTYRLHRKEWCVHIEDCLSHLDALVEQNRNFDFYWHPRRDEAQLRTMNVPGEDPEELHAELAPREGVLKEHEDWSHAVIPESRGLKFEEMEYMLPTAAFPDVSARSVNGSSNATASTLPGGCCAAPLPPTTDYSARSTAATP